MKTENIKAIFTNLLFVIGVILLIFGFIHGTQTVVRLFTFEKYPLQSYEETRCDLEYLPDMPAVDSSVKAPPQPDLERQERCKMSLERERRVKQTEDVVAAITTFVAGAVLVMSFRRFIFK